MSETGMYWHVHHDILCEWCYDFDERVRVIKTTKPANEIETRLRLFQPIRGELPAKVTKACAKYAKAWAEYAKARAKVTKAYAEYDKAFAEYDKACAKVTKASAKVDKAFAEYATEIKVLHAIECPNCPHNGTEIVFPEEQEKENE